MPLIDRERRQHRKHALVEEDAQIVLLLVGQFCIRANRDPFVAERGHQIVAQKFREALEGRT